MEVKVLMDKKIFLSYCQKIKNEADIIDTAFSRKGIELTRDERDLEYKEEIEKFMQKVGSMILLFY